MKLETRMFCCVVLLVLAAAPAVAGGIINKSNQSADYIRTLNRSAATDQADIAVYNPAGVMQLENGNYFKLDIMSFAKDYSNTVPGFGELEQDVPSIIPAMFLVHKRDRWAGYFAFTVPAGGGKLDYEEGSARTVALAQGVRDAYNAGLGNAGVPSDFFYSQIDDMSIKINASTVFGFTLGGSFALTDQLSGAVGMRYTNGKREFEGQATISAATEAPSPPFPEGTNAPLTPELHLEEDADAFSAIVGLNFAATEKLNAAVTFISNAGMEYEMNVHRDNLGLTPGLGYADGSLRRIDIPAQIGTGVSYQFTPELKLDANFISYLESDAEIDTFGDYGNSWDLGLSAEYRFSPRWKASAGYLKTSIGLDANQQINEPEEPKLDANTVGAGIVFSPTPRWDLTIGGILASYDEVTDDLGITYSKTVWNVSAGLQYRFF